MGRPKVKIDIDEVKRLALLNCHTRTIARLAGCTEKTLRNRGSALIKHCRAEYRVQLTEAQRNKAIDSKDTNMLKWLGIQHLEQTDKQEIKTEVQEKRELSELEKAEAVRLASIRLRQDIAQEAAG